MARLLLSGWARPAVWISLLLLPAVAAGETSSDEAALFERLNGREQILDAQASAAEATTRQRALLAYRLCRRRELGFAANPENRLADARAFDAALVALRRSSAETATLAAELDRVRVERGAIENAFVARTAAPQPAAVAAVPAVHFARPVRGDAVALPGTRRDGSAKVELHHDDVTMLARLNEPVHTVAPGTVKRVEALPQGGFAVVTAHADAVTSIVTGLRDTTVSPGDRVEAGQILGLAGRNLDGAAVVSVEIWRERRPQDVARLLRIRRGRM